MHFSSLLPVSRSKPHSYIVGIIISFFLFSTAPGVSKAAETYKYDQYNRLVIVHDGTVQLEFDYDGAGNRIAISSTDADGEDPGSGSSAGCFIFALKSEFSGPTTILRFLPEIDPEIDFD